MVNYAFFNDQNIIVSVLEFEADPENIQEFIDSQNVVFDGQITFAKKITEEDKFWGIGMELIEGQIRPPKDFNSWLWDDMLDMWVAPTPHPSVLDTENTKNYQW